MKVLIVEDERLLASSIALLLQQNGFETELAYDGEMGVEYAKLDIYDLIILDVMMPKMDGFEVARALRRQHLGTPILMLTARSGVEDRIAGLDAGADYYLPKPFDTRELIACANALVRRQKGEVNELSVGNTTLDLSSAVLCCGQKRVQLSATEFEILRFLFKSGSGNLSKERILEKVWGYDSQAVGNNVEVYIGFLRKKLTRIGSNVSIVAVRRLGYHLEVESVNASQTQA